METIDKSGHLRGRNGFDMNSEILCRLRLLWQFVPVVMVLFNMVKLDSVMAVDLQIMLKWARAKVKYLL